MVHYRYRGKAWQKPKKWCVGYAKKKETKPFINPFEITWSTSYFIPFEKKYWTMCLDGIVGPILVISVR